MSCIESKKKIVLLSVIGLILIFLTSDIAVGKDITIHEDTTKFVTEYADKLAEEIKIQEEESHWVYYGSVRCTEYCASCNLPSGHTSSSGTYLSGGHVACSWLKLGTRIRLNGYEFVVVDRCGTDAIDIFRDTDGCYCNMNEYKELEIYVP